MTVQASQDDHRLAMELLDQIPSWLESSQLKPNSVKLMDLDSIRDGFEQYRQGKISAEMIQGRPLAPNDHNAPKIMIAAVAALPPATVLADGSAFTAALVGLPTAI